jgi:hypothetical protein
VGGRFSSSAGRSRVLQIGFTRVSFQPGEAGHRIIISKRRVQHRLQRLRQLCSIKHPLLEPPPCNVADTGEFFFRGTFDLPLEEPGDHPVRHRTRRDTAWAQFLHGKGEYISHITPG